MKSKKNYELLLADLEKHSELIKNCGVLSRSISINSAKSMIFKADLIENYGWVMPDHKLANDYYFNITDEICAGTFGGDTKRTIAWEDDAKDPNGQFLLNIRFSTGPYFFGQDYPTELFKEFFNELCEFEPDYKDTTNKSLYFNKEKAGKVLHEYDDIVKKYKERYRNEADKRKADKLRAELAKLESKQ